MSKSEATIKVSADFSDEPYGRYPKHGDYNGERFREEFLLPALRQHERVLVDLGDTYGYGPSFLEEAFGGLVRLGYFSSEELREKLLLTSSLEFEVIRAWKHVDEAEHSADSAFRAEMDSKYRPVS
jgi:hypothetical protein